MPEKLLSLKELSDYLNISEEEIRKFVDDNIIPAYRIGGSFLRFRKEQIDAIKDEICTRTPHAVPQYRVKVDFSKKEAIIESRETIVDKISDFFYFSDFYIISLVLIGAMLFVIFRM